MAKKYQPKMSKLSPILTMLSPIHDQSCCRTRNRVSFAIDQDTKIYNDGTDTEIGRIREGPGRPEMRKIIV